MNSPQLLGKSSRDSLLGPKNILPFAVFVFSALCSWIIAYSEGYSDFFIQCWSRWDSGHYIDIAQHGHNLALCNPNDHSPRSAWCGNAGWAPLYPFLIYLLNAISGMHLELCGVAISGLFFFGFLLVCSRLLEINSYQAKQIILLCICAFCPGSIYYHAIFPISMLVFFIALAFLSIEKNNFCMAGFSLFFATLSHSVGFFLIGVLGLWILYLMLSKSDKTNQVIAKILLPTIAGLLVWFSYDFIVTGHWNATFLVQKKYEYQIITPWKMMGLRFQNLWANQSNIRIWIELQNFTVLFITLIVPIYIFLRSKNKFVDVLLGLFQFFLFWLPYCMGIDVSIYRSAGIQGPVYYSFQKMPTILLLAILAIFLSFFYFHEILFLNGIIV